MRREFSKAIEELGRKDENLFFLTGDLGFDAFENLQSSFKNRFINAGVAEASMVSIAAGMAYMGAVPWVYSIAPFIVLKTVEQLRNDICHLNLPVKLIGNGGGYGYGLHGATHHVLEDIAILQSLPNMKIYVPAFYKDVKRIVKKMHSEAKPGYIRLARAPQITLDDLSSYAPLRNVLKGRKVTCIVLGSLIHNVIQAINQIKDGDSIDVWVVTELPFEFNEKLLQSIKKTKKLIIIEEHAQNGGLGTYCFNQILKNKTELIKVTHLFANGYPSGLYGDQDFHWHENKLDGEGIALEIKKMF
jgi:transketolase